MAEQMPYCAKNIELVRDMLALISSNDIPAAISTMAEDVDWQSPVTNSAGGAVSWASPRQGRAEVMAFFYELFNRTGTFELTPESFMAGEDRVVVEGSTHGTITSTGRDYRTQWVMLVTVKNGQISRLRHYFDTADLLKALEPAGMRKAA